MNAADEVEAAIDKLQDLRRKWLVDPRNQLFVTLHATIDAQLAILGYSARYATPSDTSRDLARAINGATS